ncbi:MAG: hypothetical protein NZM37_09320 [Sandaracinaceae bacterium]|nr:hypothetical protein [Sandaracinaceae bacterium]MDW8246519.1 hypothetical protein [Sandaracinaceae bacterium]
MRLGMVLGLALITGVVGACERGRRAIWSASEESAQQKNLALRADNQHEPLPNSSPTLSAHGPGNQESQKSSGPSTLAFQGLDEASRQALRQLTFPVLLFPSSYRFQVLATDGQPWVVVRAEGDGVFAVLHGSVLAYDALDAEERAQLPPPSHVVRGQPARLTTNEGIITIAWTEGGVSWSLDLECARPAVDPRCNDNRFILDLAEQLIRVDPRQSKKQ